MHKEIKKIWSKNGEANVEDLLSLLAIDDPSIVMDLKQLKKEFNWKPVDNPEKEVPLGSWVDIICLFLEQGYEALYTLATQSSRLAEIVLGVLEELKDERSLDIIASIIVFYREKKDQLNLESRCIGSINLMLSFDYDITLEPQNKKYLRELIYNFINRVDIEVSDLEFKEEFISTAYCALRRVGDHETIQRIKKRPRLQAAEYNGLETIIVKAIKKNMDNEG